MPESVSSKETKQAKYIKKHRELGLCYACNRPASSYRCTHHQHLHNLIQRKRVILYKAAGKCYTCGQSLEDIDTLQCVNCTKHLSFVRFKE